MSDHALLAPSASHRWMNCTPSAVLETEFDNKSSPAAAEGTAAHALCEHKLKRMLHRRSKRPVSDYNSDEMEEHTDAYVEFVSELLEKAKLQRPIGSGRAEARPFGVCSGSIRDSRLFAHS